MVTEKIIGYLLLVIGLAVIIGSVFSVYQVFTGKSEPVQVFSFEMPGIKLPGGSQPSLSEIKLPEGMELPEGFSLPQESPKQAGQETELKLLPDEVINRMINMSVYLFLMGFVASGGAKIAHIGVKLIKDIRVEVKEEKIKASV